MKLVLVWELLSLPFIVRYCVASDPNPSRPPDSDTTSISTFLPEEISKGNPISPATDETNSQRGEPNPDQPFNLKESLELHSQSKSDPCLSDKNQAPSSRRRLRRQSCQNHYVSPERALKAPVSLPPIPTWGNSDLNIPKNEVPWFGGIKEDPELCADDWINMPVCAPESFAIGDYLPSCRPRILFCEEGDILFCCGFVAPNPWWTVTAGLSQEQLRNIKYPYYGISCLSGGGLI